MVGNGGEARTSYGSYLKYLIATIIIGRGDVSKKVARVEGEKKKYITERERRDVLLTVKFFSSSI